MRPGGISRRDLAARPEIRDAWRAPCVLKGIAPPARSRRRLTQAVDADPSTLDDAARVARRDEVDERRARRRRRPSRPRALRHRLRRRLSSWWRGVSVATRGACRAAVDAFKTARGGMSADRKMRRLPQHLRTARRAARGAVWLKRVHLHQPRRNTNFGPPRWRGGDSDISRAGRLTAQSVGGPLRARQGRRRTSERYLLACWMSRSRSGISRTTSNYAMRPRRMRLAAPHVRDAPTSNFGLSLDSLRIAARSSGQPTTRWTTRKCSARRRRHVRRSTRRYPRPLPWR